MSPARCSARSPGWSRCWRCSYRCRCARSGAPDSHAAAAFITPVLARPLGPKALIGVVIFAFALAWGLSQLLGKDADDPPASGSGSGSVTSTATPCTDVADPFGAPPDTFAYEKVD